MIDCETAFQRYGFARIVEGKHRIVSVVVGRKIIAEGGPVSMPIDEIARAARISMDAAASALSDLFDMGRFKVTDSDLLIEGWNLHDCAPGFLKTDECITH